MLRPVIAHGLGIKPASLHQAAFQPKIVHNRFYVFIELNEAVDKVRREEPPPTIE
jgi:hypothetical protein